MHVHIQTNSICMRNNSNDYTINSVQEDKVENLIGIPILLWDILEGSNKQYCR